MNNVINYVKQNFEYTLTQCFIDNFIIRPIGNI